MKNVEWGRGAPWAPFGLPHPFTVIVGGPASRRGTQECPPSVNFCSGEAGSLGELCDLGESKPALVITKIPDPLHPGGKGRLILRQFIVASIGIVTDYTQ